MFVKRSKPVDSRYQGEVVRGGGGLIMRFVEYFIYLLVNVAADQVSGYRRI